MFATSVFFGNCRAHVPMHAAYLRLPKVNNIPDHLTLCDNSSGGFKARAPVVERKVSREGRDTECLCVSLHMRNLTQNDRTKLEESGYPGF